MPEHYHRYGFKSNPFAVRGLDLLKNENDRVFLRLIDGFKQLRPAVRYLRERVRDGGPAFVLIKGGEKSGLSTAASVLLRMYRLLRRLKREQFAAVVVEAPNHSPLDLYNEWTARLYNIVAMHLKLNLDEEVKKSFLQARSLSNPKNFGLDLQLVVHEIRTAFDAPPGAAFASCFERIKTAEMVETARVIFEDIPTLCVFTVRPNEFDQDVTDFHNKNGDLHYMELGALAAGDVRRVVQARWGNSNPVAIDLDELGAIFAAQGRTVGALLETVDRMLTIKARANPLHDAHDVWPHDGRLCIDTQSTRDLFEAVINGGH